MILLAISASLALNLVVQFGLGAYELISKKTVPLPFLQAGVLFVSVLFLWAVFTYAIIPLFSIFFGYILFFPLCSMVCVGLENLVDRFRQSIFPKLEMTKVFSPLSAYDGIALFSLVLTIHIAGTFLEAFIVSLSFAIGVLFSILILNEIRKKASTEVVPTFLQGKPLMLISMGFLSLIFTSSAMLLFNALTGR
jgi:electron transport complex protein RnfA